ncbi:hypothetical protein [Clostridium butyricum]|uniref:hypothetical protein n=1 Tax=Clostridium butyricum TaxID=1492 RepID=UPI0009034729|nr:hypothetical protein [Clostridium butyricum]APF21545.1 hypothetical protein NPD4_3578 [Clostridium butyricum]
MLFVGNDILDTISINEMDSSSKIKNNDFLMFIDSDNNTFKISKENLLEEVYQNIFSLYSNIKDLNIKKRFFNPQLGIFMDLNPNGGIEISQEKMINNLELIKKYKIEKLVIQPWVIWDESTKKLTLKNSIENLKFLINEATKREIKIACLKIHFYNINYSNLISSGNIDSFISQYKALISDFLSYFKEINIPYVIPFNECSVFYKKNSLYIDFVNTVLYAVKDLGFKVGISTMGAKETLEMDDTIKKNVDDFFVNCYPKISYKFEETTYRDCINSWDNSYEHKCVQQIKSDFPNKKIIMSETGCNDYWVSLCNPGNWKLTGNAKTGGLAPMYMLEGLFRSDMQDYIEEVWWCYWDSILNDNCKNIIERYIGGI